MKQRRRDAQRNREALVAAAREVFGRGGVDRPLDEVARRAEVSIGTLYNHFPTRSALIDAAFSDHARAGARVVEEALEIDDPWEAFERFLIRISELQAADRGYTDVCSRSFPDAPGVETAKARGAELMDQLVSRAKRAGVLRPDFSTTDLAFLSWGIARTTEMTRQVAPEAWRRHLGLLLDGLRAESASPLPAPALDAGQLGRAMGAEQVSSDHVQPD